MPKTSKIDKDTLTRLYCEQNLSDASIGKMFGMTDIAIAYNRKKYDIEHKKVIDKLKDECGTDELTVTLAAQKYGVNTDFMRRQVKGIKPVRVLHRVPIYKATEIDDLMKYKTPPKGSLTCKQMAEILNTKPRNVRERLATRGIKPIAKLHEDFYDAGVVDLIKSGN